MKKYLKAFCMCFSMFCAIPTPFMHVWDASLRGIMLTMFPFVGIVTGLLWSLLGFLLCKLGCPVFLTAAILAMFPYLVTGGMHLDGYMDCCDAIFSRRDLERRREILKDSHVGSFAVVGLAMLFLFSFAVFASVKENANFFILLIVSVVSRACSALGITLLKPMDHSEYAGDFHKSICFTNVVIIVSTLVIAVLAGMIFLGWKSLVASVFTMAGYWLSVWYAYKQFDGFSGDVTGFGHTIAELCGTLAFVLL